MTNEILRHLENMLAGVEPYSGTILCRNGTLGIYWSPYEWNSPSDGLIHQPECWVYLGQSTYWANDKMKEMYSDLLNLVGGFPASPAEYDYHPPRPQV